MLLGLLCVVTAPAGALAHGGLKAQLADLDQRLAVEGESCELYLARGNVHRLHRDWVAALADFSRAAQLDPTRPEVDYFRARVYLDSEQLDLAEAHVKRLLARLPAEAGADLWRGPAHLLLAQALARHGRPLDAAEQYDQAIAKLAHPRPQVYLERAQALRAVEPALHERAVRGLDQGLARLGPIVTLEQLALELEIESGDYNAALVRVERLLAKAPRTETWLVKKGEILERAGRLRDATRTFEAAQAAWLEVPAGRRLSRAMVSLERRIHAGLERLGRSGGAGR